MYGSSDWKLRVRNVEDQLPVRGTACVVEVDADERKRFAERLRDMGFKVLETGSGEVAQFIATQVRLRVVFVDIDLPDMNGLTLIKRLRALLPDAVIVALSPGPVAKMPLFSELAHCAGADAAFGLEAAARGWHEAVSTGCHRADD